MTIVDPDETLTNALAEFVIADEGVLISTAKERGVADPEAILTSFKAIIDKWDGLLADVDRKDADALAQLARTEIYDLLDEKTYGVD